MYLYKLPDCRGLKRLDRLRQERIRSVNANLTSVHGADGPTVSFTTAAGLIPSSSFPSLLPLPTQSAFAAAADAGGSTQTAGQASTTTTAAAGMNGGISGGGVAGASSGGGSGYGPYGPMPVGPSGYMAVSRHELSATAASGVDAASASAAAAAAAASLVNGGRRIDSHGAAQRSFGDASSSSHSASEEALLHKQASIGSAGGSMFGAEDVMAGARQEASTLGTGAVPHSTVTMPNYKQRLGLE